MSNQSSTDIEAPVFLTESTFLDRGSSFGRGMDTCWELIFELTAGAVISFSAAEASMDGGILFSDSMGSR